MRRRLIFETRAPDLRSGRFPRQLPGGLTDPKHMAISGLRAEGASIELLAPRHAVRVAVPSVDPEPAFSRALRGLAREIDLGERQLLGASELRSYDTASLIALQSGIYRYTEAVDLSSKIVDRATSAVRTVLQGAGH